MQKNNYTIYHVHSPYSNANAGMDCVTPIELTIGKAKEFGMTSLAFSEHGNVYDWITKKEKIEAVGMKYIHAIEAYVTETLEDKIWEFYIENEHYDIIDISDSLEQYGLKPIVDF